VEVKVPELGDVEEAEIIEVLVGSGDTIAVDDPLITLESDKASMEVPSTAAGTIEKIAVGEGDKVSEGDVILTLRTTAADKGGKPEQKPQRSEPPKAGGEKKKSPEKASGESATPREKATSSRPDS